jgi:Rrf2 family transcriptional regulator, iron-sulfur cluster assembly transcription factor
MLNVAASNGKKLCTINSIAEEESIPREYLAKILKELVQMGFLKSHKGIHGGYNLARSRDQITFLEIIEAVDGPMAITFCNLSEAQKKGYHRKGACGAAQFFVEMQKRLAAELGGMNLGKIDYEKYYPGRKK